MRLDIAEALTARVREPQWIVEGNTPEGTIVLVAGDAGVGKSVLHISEGFHIVLGIPFLGQPTVSRKVLYFDEENSHADILKYLQQIWVGMGKPDPEKLTRDFRLEHFSLGNLGWADRALAIVQEHQPGIIYIDTATSALAIQEENDNSEAQRTVKRLRRIIAESGCNPAIKVLKHAKYQSSGDKGGTRRTIRGGKAWLGAVDQTQFHIRAPGRPPKNGLHTTVLVPDKTRAFGLKRHLRVLPAWTDEEHKGLVLQGEVFEPARDLMVTE